MVSYGAGVDSTAMLIGMATKGIRPDLILMADTGGEKPETYAYLPTMDGFLRKVGFPEVTVVRKVPTKNKRGTYKTLEGNCLVNRTLPSLAFGRKSCSLKWKVEPMDKYVNRWEPAREAWKAGLRVRRAIGYDCGPKDSRRAWKMAGDGKFEYVYFLREWGWDRERCSEEILRAGLTVPPKSACFFCPATTPKELEALYAEHPDLCERIVAMENAAAPNLRQIEGLWRNGTKGTRGGQKKPGRMTTFLRVLQEGGRAV